jgi:hypothetical protein
MNVKELEIAVTKLSPSNLNEFASWFENYQENLWDKQIENDVKSGKLDSLLKDVKLEFDNNNFTSI